MVDCQLRPNTVTDERVTAAFRALRRELFVPEGLRATAYADRDLPLGKGRYLMAPMVAARLIQALAIARGDAALVVGAGVGYEAAAIARLGRSVIAVEEDPELARLGRAALVDHGIAAVKYVEEPAVQGGRVRPAYDAILIAGAVTEIPAKIEAQLAEGGRLAAVVRTPGNVGRATLVTRTGGILAHRVIFDAATPLLPEFAGKPAFVF